MRRRKRLVQIDVHHVDAEIAGPRDADQRVHVGAVHVEHGAFFVQNFGHARDVIFEHAERVRVGDHQRGHVTGDQLFQRAEIDWQKMGEEARPHAEQARKLGRNVDALLKDIDRATTR